MSWIIDEFSVKPSGLFSSWRYKRILIDNDGNLTTSNVPGKESINLPCISDYNKKSRRFNNGQLITEFCNTITFTNYRVYAENCTPFARVETDLNAPKCGYQEPLPEPAVPPNPFGTAVYGAYKYFEFQSVKLVNYRVNIYKKDFSGTATAINLGDADPVVLTYNTEDEDDKFSPIRACECNLSFICDENFDLQELYTADERAFKVEVLNTDTNEIKFYGFIIPDSCREPFSSPPYPVSIRATDGLGALKKITYPLPVGSKIDIRQSFKDILCYCFAMTNLNLDLFTICNLYEAKMLTGLDDDPLAQATVNPLRLSDDQGNIKSCYDVLIDICKLFGAYVVQVDGRWVFVRINELSNAVIRGRLYSYTGLFKRGEQVSNSRIASHTDEDVTVLNGGDLRTVNAYKRVIVLTEFGNTATSIYNGDFEIWDGQNFRYWTRYGGINISRVQKTITGTGGQKIGIEDYVCRFNEKTDSGKWLEASTIIVDASDKINFSFSLGTENWDNKSIGYSHEIKIRFKIGQYYLSGVYITSVGEAKFEWVRRLSVVTIYSPSGYDINTNKVGFSIPEMPESGSLAIQMYGASHVNIVYQGFTNTIARIDEVLFKPALFDNINISKTSQNEKDAPDGFWSISEQLGFYTNSPDEIKIPYSDAQNLNQVVGVSGTLALQNLYAIYTSDNSFSTNWKDYNESGAPLPISLSLARTILKAYQKPFRIYSGDLRGDNLNYLNVFNFNIEDNAEFSAKTFAVMSGELSLKYHQLSSASLAEIFSKPIFTTNYQTPHTPGQIPPALTQNPNNPITDVRVFSDEFTNPFS